MSALDRYLHGDSGGVPIQTTPSYAPVTTDAHITPGYLYTCELSAPVVLTISARRDEAVNHRIGIKITNVDGEGPIVAIVVPADQQIESPETLRPGATVVLADVGTYAEWQLDPLGVWRLTALINNRYEIEGQVTIDGVPVVIDGVPVVITPGVYGAVTVGGVPVVIDGVPVVITD